MLGQVSPPSSHLGALLEGTGQSTGRGQVTRRAVKVDEDLVKDLCKPTHVYEA
jgi:hypothetical protein